MAEIQPTVVRDDAGAQVFTWSNMASGDTGYPVKLPNYADKSVHFYGTGGTGPSVSLYGSNAPEDINNPATSGSYVVLTNHAGEAITKTSVPSMEQVLENPLLVAPAVTAGSGSSINVTIVCK